MLRRQLAVVLHQNVWNSPKRGKQGSYVKNIAAALYLLVQ
jgi:hypothetical protein